MIIQGKMLGNILYLFNEIRLWTITSKEKNNMQLYYLNNI